MNKWLSFSTLFLFLLISCCLRVPEEDPYDCNEYWERVSLSAFCDIDILAHFDTDGVVDLCNANSNSSYPNTELVYIFIANAYTESGAEEDFEEIKLQDSSSPKFQTVANLGDDAYAIRTESTLGGLGHIIIEARSGKFTLTVEVNFSESGGNCLDEGGAYEFTRALIQAL